MNAKHPLATRLGTIDHCSYVTTPMVPESLRAEITASIKTCGAHTVLYVGGHPLCPEHARARFTQALTDCIRGVPTDAQWGLR